MYSDRFLICLSRAQRFTRVLILCQGRLRNGTDDITRAYICIMASMSVRNTGNESEIGIITICNAIRSFTSERICILTLGRSIGTIEIALASNTEARLREAETFILINKDGERRIV